jgi:hypothetical protein
VRVKRIVIGVFVIVASEIGMLLKLEPFWSWHTPIAWTGYILLVDGVVYLRRRSSWLSDSPKEFAFLALVSVPLWLVFEFYNLFIRNWHYINLPESAFWRDVGYVWAFATIWPAIFETADLVVSLRHPASLWTVETARFHQSRAHEPPARRLSSWGVVSIVIGALMLTWPLVWPSRYLAAPVWLGFVFLLDPLNARVGRQSLTADYRHGGIACFSHLPGSEGKSVVVRRADRAINLMIGGLFCGFVWEFWNYWARTKWIYTVPILEHVKLFEMPLPGYLGFPVFALECFTMYVAIRLLLGGPDGRPIAL